MVKSIIECEGVVKKEEEVISDEEIEGVDGEVENDHDDEVENENENENDDSTGVTITTTIGSGPNKRKEIMTLPLPPGSLPPRKRAKTKDEKEQRRIERIMRNRQAAHASREKKRKHVEELEKKCVVLTSENEQLQVNIRQIKESQVQMLEQHYLLMAKVQQLQNVLKTAKTTGDLSVLDTADFTISLPSMPTVMLSEGSSSSGSSTSSSTSSSSSPPTSNSTPTILPSSNSNLPLTSLSTPPSLLLHSPIIKQEECTSPEALLLSNIVPSVPSLSSSVSNSPHTSDSLEFDDSSNESTSISTPTYIKQELFEDEDIYTSLENSNRAHHPAEMMFDQQRLRLTKFSRVSISHPITV